MTHRAYRQFLRGPGRALLTPRIELTSMIGAPLTAAYEDGETQGKVYRDVYGRMRIEYDSYDGLPLIYLSDLSTRTITYLLAAHKTAQLFTFDPGPCGIPASWRPHVDSARLRILSEEEPDPSLFMIPSDYKVSSSGIAVEVP